MPYYVSKANHIDFNENALPQFAITAVTVRKSACDWDTIPRSWGFQPQQRIRRSCAEAGSSSHSRPPPEEHK